MFPDIPREVMIQFLEAKRAKTMKEEARESSEKQNTYSYTSNLGTQNTIYPCSAHHIEKLNLWFKRLDEQLEQNRKNDKSLYKDITIAQLYFEDWIFKLIADSIITTAGISLDAITLDQLADLILPGSDEEGNALPAILKRVNNLP